MARMAPKPHDILDFTMPDAFHALEEIVTQDVTRALAEDVGPGDLTARLVPADRAANARLMTRQDGVLCGTEWFNRTFEELDPDAEIFWHHRDGDDIVAGSSLCELEGSARALLTGERTAINFVQLLSGIATGTRAFVRAIEGTKARILDTRKTLPGLRLAQKYAVATGGGTNNRIGLYDGILIKDNHLAGRGGDVQLAVETARSAPGNDWLPVEVEVDTLEQLEEALAARADIVLLDNMTPDQMRTAVQRRAAVSPDTKLEASGGVNLDTVRGIAATGVDRISVGALTHSAPALDIGLDYLT